MKHNLTGQRFGRLVALKYLSGTPGKWDCRCDCGNRTMAITGKLLDGKKKSCGCARTPVRPSVAIRNEELKPRRKNSARLIEYKGEMRTINSLCWEAGISRACIHYRLKHWPIERVMSKAIPPIDAGKQAKPAAKKAPAAVNEEMLEALRAIVDGVALKQCTMNLGLVQAASNAIKKALGEQNG